MPDDNRLVYWDSCCFLSYINGDDDRVDVLEALLADSKNQRSPLRIVTSAVSITEVAYAEAEKTEGASPDVANEAIESLWADVEAVRLVEFSRGVAEIARRLVRQASFRAERLGIVDAIHLATAMQLSVIEFHTYDGKLKKFEDITGLRIGEPTTLQAATVPKPPGQVSPSAASGRGVASGDGGREPAP